MVVYKTHAPGIDDSATVGFINGMLWVNRATTPFTLYACSDNTPGAAQWIQVGTTSATGTPVAWVNVKNYGLNVGTGGDDTAAINAAAAVAISGNLALYFPASTYHYTTGSGLSGANLVIIGDGRAVTSIVLSGNYFVSSSLKWTSFHLEGISFSGGLGAVQHLFTGVNVTNQHVIRDVDFLQYTRCAVYTQASDMPYWHVQNCTFNAANDETTIGFAHSGKPDSSAWISCAFNNNRVGLKLMQGGDAAYIHACEFIRLNPYTTYGRYGLWVVPSPVYEPAGQGFSCVAKFGGENLSTAEIPVCYADEDLSTGSDTGGRLPLLGRSVTDGVMNNSTTLTSATAVFTSADVGRNVVVKQGLQYGLSLHTTIASVTNPTTAVLAAPGTAGSVSGLTVAIGVSNGYIAGHIFNGCEVGGWSPSPPFVYSTCPNLRGCMFGPLCLLPYPPAYILQMLYQPDPDAYNSDNQFGPFYGDGVGTASFYSVNISNVAGMGFVIDPRGRIQSGHDTSQLTSNDMVGFALLTIGYNAYNLINGFSLQSGATCTPTLNPYGRLSAGAISLPTPTSAIQALLAPGSAVVAGKPIFMKLNVKAASSNPLSFLQVSIWEAVPGGTNHYSQQLQMTPEWRPITLKFVPRITGDANLLFQLTQPLYGGTGANALVEVEAIYTNESPINVMGEFPNLIVQGLPSPGHNPILWMESNLTGNTIDSQDSGVSSIPLILNPSGGRVETDGPFRILVPDGSTPYQADFGVGPTGLTVQVQQNGVGALPLGLNTVSGGDVGMGNPSGFNVADQVGFFFMPSTPGAPTGFPVLQSSFPNGIACRIDPVDGKLWAYYGGSWHYCAFT
jgi:hypothetical protein